MTPADVDADRKDAPERIWAWPFHPGHQNDHMIGGWFIAQHRNDVEYIRADLHTARIAALEAQWAAQDDAWCDRVDVLLSGIAALEVSLADLADAYAGCNGEDHPAYVKARALLGDKP